MTEEILVKKLKRRKAAAKARGLEFTLTLEDYKTLVSCRVCYYTGVQLEYYGISEGTMPPNAWTLDRVDSSLGYIPGNVVVCSAIANNIKGACFDSVAMSRVDPDIYKAIQEKLCRVSHNKLSFWSRLKKAWAIIIG